MTPKKGKDGRAVEPMHGLVPESTYHAGDYVPFTDGTRRPIHKVEQTVASQADRVMVTTTILFVGDETRWLKTTAKP